MERDAPANYLRAAFLNVYNLSLLLGAGVASVMTGDYALGAVVLGLEALWLLLGPDLKPFQRAVDRSDRAAREAEDRKRVRRMLESLPQREWQRAHALDELRREIARDMQVNPSFQAILLQSEIDKLDRLLRSFVLLATACTRAETYLAATNIRELEAQLTMHQKLGESAADAGAKAIADKNVVVLQRRLATIQDIERFLTRARGQMSLIENTVRLLRDQVLTMARPSELGDQLDDLLTGVEAIQATVRDADLVDFEPIAPIAAVTPAEPERPKNRTKA